MGKKVFIVKENMMCADDTEQKEEQTLKPQKDTCHTNEFMPNMYYILPYLIYSFSI